MGEATRHGQNTSCLVLEHEGGTLHDRANSQLRLRSFVTLIITDTNEHDVVRLELCAIRTCRQRKSSAVPQPYTKPGTPFEALAGGSRQDQCSVPMHVVERKPRELQRFLPRGDPSTYRRRGLSLRFQALNRI